MTSLQIKRGTRAQLNTAASGNQLNAGEPYLITDENRLAVGLSATTYQDYAKLSEAGGAPAGSTGEVQYNNAGAFAGAANVEIEGGNLRLVDASDPSTPAPGGINLYSKLTVGRQSINVIDAVGEVDRLQRSFSDKKIFMMSMATGSTAPSFVGGHVSSAVTHSHQQTIASANPWQARRRWRGHTSTTAGTTSGLRTTYGQWFLGGAAGFGGFFFRGTVGANINLNGGQKFFGLCNSTASLAGEPSALLNMIGMGYDAADASTGNWQFMRNDGSGTATKVDLGATHGARGTTHGWELIMYAKPNSSEVFVKITNLHTGGVCLDTSYTTDIPAVNTALAMKCEVRNGAVAAADSIESDCIYIEANH